MEKKYIIGGLAIVGAIALISYLNKPKKKSEGFLGADGLENGGCALCRSGNSRSLYWAGNGYCRQGDTCKRSLIKQKVENDAQNKVNSVYYPS